LNRFLIEGERGPGGPPFGEPAGGTEDEIVEESDWLLRSGISFQVPIVSNLTTTGSLSHMTFMPGFGDSRSDFELSAAGGMRFSWIWNPEFMSTRS